MSFWQKFVKPIQDNLKNIFINKFYKEDPSEDLDFLFSPGHIEKLVSEGRIPICNGTLTIGSEVKKYYHVPPRDHNPDELVDMYTTLGATIMFVYKDGSQKMGYSYSLDGNQAKLLEQRVQAEVTRLGLDFGLGANIDSEPEEN